MIRSFLYLLPFVLLACQQSAKEEPATKTVQQEQAPSAARPPVPTKFDNDVNRFGNQQGVVGVFEIGQMLALSITDSAVMQNMADKSARAFEILEQDMHAIGAESDGPLGQISYNNNPDNFKFECILLIRKFPDKQPPHSKIVVLEASHMLVYNHYGPYQELYKSYGKIRSFCTENGLVQTAPVREFYISDPSIEKDPSHWLTRILLPVSARSQ